MMTPLHILQLAKNGERHIALVQNSRAVLLDDFSSLYALALAAIEENKGINILDTPGRNYSDRITMKRGNFEFKKSYESSFSPLGASSMLMPK